MLVINNLDPRVTIFQTLATCLKILDFNEMYNDQFEHLFDKQIIKEYTSKIIDNFKDFPYCFILCCELEFILKDLIEKEYISRVSYIKDKIHHADKSLLGIEFMASITLDNKTITPIEYINKASILRLYYYYLITDNNEYKGITSKHFSKYLNFKLAKLGIKKCNNTIGFNLPTEYNYYLGNKKTMTSTKLGLLLMDNVNKFYNYSFNDLIIKEVFTDDPFNRVRQILFAVEYYQSFNKYEFSYFISAYQKCFKITQDIDYSVDIYNLSQKFKKEIVRELCISAI